MLLGAPMPGGPDDPKVFPRFPLVLVDDIPLMLIDSYLLAGEAESPEVHVGYFRKHGKLRALPLVPSITPFKSLDQFAKSPRWIKLTGGDDEFGKGWRSTLSHQLLRLLSSVHQTDNQEAMQFFDDRHQQWLRASVKKASRLKIRWDAKAHRFTFRDGKFFTKPKPVHYHREVWRPKVKEVDLEIILERSSPTEVTLQVYETIEAGKRIPSVAIRVYPADSTDKALAEIHTEAQKAKKLKAGEHGFSGSLSTKTFKLLDGGMVRLRLSVSGKTLSTPVFNP